MESFGGMEARKIAVLRYCRSTNFPSLVKRRKLFWVIVWVNILNFRVHGYAVVDIYNALSSSKTRYVHSVLISYLEH